MPVPLAIGAAIVVWGAYSGYRQAQLGNAQKRQQAAIAEMNADTAELEGDLALKSGFRLEHESRRQTAQLIGVQRGAMASSGFAVGEGSFGDILEGTAVLGEVDAMVIQYESELIKFRKQREAAGFREQAEGLRESQQDPFLAALGGGLGGASSFASS